MNYVLIKAGGTGIRMQPCDRPKQFIEVQGKPIILYTMEQFQKNDQIDGICVSCIKGWEGYLQDFAQRFGVTKFRWLTGGGMTAQQSIYNGIQELSPVCAGDDIIIIHDAVRPLVSQYLISASLNCAAEYGAAVVTAPCFETMLWSEDGKMCTRTYSRSKLFQSRAPQAYRYSDLQLAYREADKLGIVNSLSTDDLFIRLGKPIHQVVGSVHNIKITTKEDVMMFEAMVAYGAYTNEVWNA